MPQNCSITWCKRVKGAKDVNLTIQNRTYRICYYHAEYLANEGVMKFMDKYGNQMKPKSDLR